jgi:transposase
VIRLDREHVYSATCPHCGCEAGIPLSLAGKFWLADTSWQCPRCSRWVDRNDMQEEKPKSKEGGTDASGGNP